MDCRVAHSAALSKALEGATLTAVLAFQAALYFPVQTLTLFIFFSSVSCPPPILAFSLDRMFHLLLSVPRGGLRHVCLLLVICTTLRTPRFSCERANGCIGKSWVGSQS